jgi:enoyl-CoA hydratase/carnithine racemase
MRIVQRRTTGNDTQMVQVGSVNYTKYGHYGLIDVVASDRKMSTAMTGQLIDVCTGISWDEEIRAVAIMTDGNLQLPVKEQTHLAAEGSAAVEAVAKLTVPVVAVIRGEGIGFGLELSLACDIRIGTHESHFGFPGIMDGTIPCCGGTQRLPRLIGHGRAMDMILTGETIGSDEALRIGLLNRTFSSDQLESNGVDLVAAMAAKSPLALGFVKEALHGSQDLTLDQGLRMELDLYLLLFTTQDRVEGVTAFQEKREAKFTGE